MEPLLRSREPAGKLRRPFVHDADVGGYVQFGECRNPACYGEIHDDQSDTFKVRIAKVQQAPKCGKLRAAIVARPVSIHGAPL